MRAATGPRGRDDVVVVVRGSAVIDVPVHVLGVVAAGDGDAAAEGGAVGEVRAYGVEHGDVGQADGPGLDVWPAAGPGPGDDLVGRQRVNRRVTGVTTDVAGRHAHATLERRIVGEEAVNLRPGVEVER